MGQLLHPNSRKGPAATICMQQNAVQREEQPSPSHRQHDSERARVVKFVIAGGVAGGLSRTVTAPMDRLKMLLQVQESVKRMTLREGIRLMAAEGNMRSWFRGNGTNVLKIAPETSIKLALNDYLKLRLAEKGEPITPLQRLLCGGLAGAVGQGAVYPLDTVRTRLAVCHRSEYVGIWPMALRMVRNEGAASLFRGLVPSMCGILPYAGTDIMLFELFKEDLLARYDGDPPHTAILGAGMLSSSVAQVVSYPLAVIRTRLQAQGVGGRPIKYRGMGDVVHHTLRKEGVSGLYKGLIPNLIKLAPAAGISWGVFEATKKALGVDPRT